MNSKKIQNVCLPENYHNNVLRAGVPLQGGPKITFPPKRKKSEKDSPPQMMFATFSWHFKWGSIPVNLIESVDFLTGRTEPKAILIGRNQGVLPSDWRYQEIYQHLLDNRDENFKLPNS
jgi:hypothetical protein